MEAPKARLNSFCINLGILCEVVECLFSCSPLFVSSQLTASAISGYVGRHHTQTINGVLLLFCCCVLFGCVGAKNKSLGRPPVCGENVSYRITEESVEKSVPPRHNKKFFFFCSRHTDRPHHTHQSVPPPPQLKSLATQSVQHGVCDDGC
jgi:hypothetical protein